MEQIDENHRDKFVEHHRKIDENQVNPNGLRLEKGTDHPNIAIWAPGEVLDWYMNEAVAFDRLTMVIVGCWMLLAIVNRSYLWRLAIVDFGYTWVITFDCWKKVQTTWFKIMTHMSLERLAGSRLVLFGRGNSSDMHLLVWRCATRLEEIEFIEITTILLPATLRTMTKLQSPEVDVHWPRHCCCWAVCPLGCRSQTRRAMLGGETWGKLQIPMDWNPMLHIKSIYKKWVLDNTYVTYVDVFFYSLFFFACLSEKNNVGAQPHTIRHLPGHERHDLMRSTLCGSKF